MKRILIIDDDPRVIGFLQHVLKTDEYDVESTLDAKEALNLYTENPFDLAVTDILMPDLDGLELIAKLRKYNKKIIAMTGGEADLLRTAKSLGADKILQKPFSINEFRQVVEELLN